MLGSHLSIAGGMVNALLEAERLRFDTVQVFTKNQRQWRIPELKSSDRDDWRRELARLGWEDRTVSHASYLANLASPDEKLWENSIRLIRAEIDRCEALSIPFLVFHPGAHIGKSEADAHAGMERVARAVARLLKETPDARTTLCLENTAGAGTTLGRSFDELHEISSLAATILHDNPPNTRPTGSGRIGFCVDTCHALAAGYDITTDSGARRVFDDFDRRLGIDRLRVLHLNDSKGALGSRIDRHTHIGDGAAGMPIFKFVMNHPAFACVPKILETPKGETPKGSAWDSVNRRRLLRLVSSAPLGRPGEPRDCQTNGGEALRPAR